jgi:chloramphenicol O-acetyltransferase type A
VLYEEIHPGLTLPAPDGLFTFAYFEYDDDVAAFNERAREVAATARRGVDLGESEHRNWVFFTALPKVPFTSFTHATRSPDDTEPQVAFGRFSERGGRLLVPVGLQVNHRLIDGRALGEAVEGTQRELDAA